MLDVREFLHELKTFYFALGDSRHSYGKAC